MILKHLFLSCWLSFDSLIWVHDLYARPFLIEQTQAVGLFTFSPETLAKITRYGNLSWLTSLTFSLLGTSHKLRLNTARSLIENRFSGRGEKEKQVSVALLNTLREERNVLIYAMLQDGLDVMIPASTLGMISMSTGNVAFFASITSIMGGCIFFIQLFFIFPRDFLQINRCMR